MIKELQSLALDVKVLDKDGEEIDLRQSFDDEINDVGTVISEPEHNENVVNDVSLDDGYVPDEDAEAQLSDDAYNEYLSDDDLFGGDEDMNDEEF